MVAAKVTLELSIKAFERLADFLSSHEGDIADGINDFGELAELFEIVFEVKPKVDNLFRPRPGEIVLVDKLP